MSPLPHRKPFQWISRAIALTPPPPPPYTSRDCDPSSVRWSLRTPPKKLESTLVFQCLRGGPSFCTAPQQTAEPAPISRNPLCTQHQTLAVLARQLAARPRPCLHACVRFSTPRSCTCWCESRPLPSQLQWGSRRCHLRASMAAAHSTRKQGQQGQAIACAWQL